jgi:hypothetical protein
MWWRDGIGEDGYRTWEEQDKQTDQDEKKSHTTSKQGAKVYPRPYLILTRVSISGNNLCHKLTCMNMPIDKLGSIA